MLFALCRISVCNVFFCTVLCFIKVCWICCHLQSYIAFYCAILISCVLCFTALVCSPQCFFFSLGCVSCSHAVLYLCPILLFSDYFAFFCSIINLPVLYRALLFNVALPVLDCSRPTTTSLFWLLMLFYTLLRLPGVSEPMKCSQKVSSSGPLGSIVSGKVSRAQESTLIQSNLCIWARSGLPLSVLY